MKYVAKFDYADRVRTYLCTNVFNSTAAADYLALDLQVEPGENDVRLFVNLRDVRSYTITYVEDEVVPSER